MTDKDTSDKLLKQVLKRLEQIENLPRNVRDHELAKLELACQDLEDDLQPYMLELIEIHRAESRLARGDERHTTDLPEDAPAPDEPGPPTPDAIIEKYDQAVHDRLHDLYQRGVITPVQGAVLEAIGVDELRRLLGLPVPDSARKKYGVDIDRARADYMRWRKSDNRRFANVRGFKPLPRLKRAAFKRVLQEAQQAIEADRENPKPMLPEGQRLPLVVVNEKGEVAPHIGPDP